MVLQQYHVLRCSYENINNSETDGIQSGILLLQIMILAATVTQNENPIPRDMGDSFGVELSKDVVNI